MPAFSFVDNHIVETSLFALFAWGAKMKNKNERLKKMEKDYKHYCVVDAENRYKTLVLASKENGQEEIQHYNLAEGERLLDAPAPGGPFCKPRWTGTAWEESATAEEIESWKKENFGHESEMPPVNPGPTMSERIAALEKQLTDAQMAMVEIYEQTEKTSTDIMLAQAETYEKALALETRIETLEGGETNG